VSCEVDLYPNPRAQKERWQVPWTEILEVVLLMTEHVLKMARKKHYGDF